MAKASVQVNHDLFYSYSDDLILAHRTKRFAVKKNKLNYFRKLKAEVIFHFNY